MSDDLIERLEEHATDWDGSQMPDIEPAKGDPTAGTLRAAAARIRELESANYRLTEERDRLKGWADKYHDEVLELQGRLATAEADAMERAARVLARASDEIRALKPKADE